MKIKVLITAILLLAGFATMQSQNNMFDRLSDNKDISTVYISKALLSMMPKMDVGAGGADIKSLAGKLEQLEIDLRPVMFLNPPILVQITRHN